MERSGINIDNIDSYIAVIKRFPNLKKLFISDNEMGYEALVKLITEVLPNLKELRLFSVRHNDIFGKDRDKIQESIERNKGKKLESYSF